MKYDSRNSSRPNTTDRMLYSTTALTFPSGSRLRFQWRAPETVGTFHVVDLARNFMSKSGVSDADIDTDAFDDLKEDLNDAGEAVAWTGLRGGYFPEKRRDLTRWRGYWPMRSAIWG